MTLKFAVSPDIASYASAVGADVVMQNPDGVGGRYRKDVPYASLRASVRWTMTALQFVYARAFYNTSTENGSGGFLIDLVVDDDDVEEVSAHFIPGSFTWDISSGVYVVSAQLEVERNP